MVSARATVLNRLGLHARPAMAFVQLANQFRATVSLRRDDSDEMIDGKSIMQMLLLAATQGTELEIECDGPDADAALAELVRLVESRFDEE